jgi:hypothetical protein
MRRFPDASQTELSCRAARRERAVQAHFRQRPCSQARSRSSSTCGLLRQVRDRDLAGPPRPTIAGVERPRTQAAPRRSRRLGSRSRCRRPRIQAPCSAVELVRRHRQQIHPRGLDMIAPCRRLAPRR